VHKLSFSRKEASEDPDKSLHDQQIKESKESVKQKSVGSNE